MRKSAGIGVLFVVIGMAYLLTQLGVVSVPGAWLTGAVLWPMVLVVVGCLGLRGVSQHIPWGSLFFVVLGLIYVVKGTGESPWLNHMGYWPAFASLLIIFFGIRMILPRKFRDSGWPFTITVGRTGRTRRRHRNFSRACSRKKFETTQWTDWRLIGDLSVGIQPWVLKDICLSNGIGDIRINLATAHIEDGNYVINIQGFIGDVRIIVPENLDVRVDAKIRIGDIEVFDEAYSGTARSVHMEDPSYESSKRRCHIDVSLTIGDIEVVRV